MSLKKERTSWRKCKRARRTNLSAARMAALRSIRMFMAGKATKSEKFRGLISKVALAYLVLQRKNSIPDTSTAYADSLASTTHKNQIKAWTKKCPRMR